MTSPSPSEFLTFMRTVVRPAARSAHYAITSRPRIHQSIATRTFASSNVSYATGDAQKKTHATDKQDRLDIQSANSAEGRAHKASGTGGNATAQADQRDNTARAKKEHPEAPDVVIGMQDERGKKGH